MLRTHTCGDLRAADIGQRVTLCGWVRNRRDHGGLLFLDLGDRYGVTQVVIEPEAPETAREVAQSVRLEFVVKATGTVRARPDESRNPDRTTGDVEVEIDEFELLSRSDPMPIAVTGERSAEELGQKYRYLEMRRPEVRDAIVGRAKVHAIVREFMNAQDCIEVETPYLLRSTPEGARDYLVPSRVHRGSFYALLQSPQLLKQLLMIGGLDRYWQIVRCFRDEDPRADRQPEFTQLDVELSFADEADVQGMVEGLVTRLIGEVASVDVQVPFPRITFADSMRMYGNDRPDLRFGMPVHEVSQVLTDCTFGVFSGAIKAGGCVRALAVPAANPMTRRQLDALPAVVVDRGARGVAWCRVGADAWSGPAAKHLTDEERAGLTAITGVEDGGILLFLAGPEKVVVAASGDLRLHLGKLLGLIDDQAMKPVWVVDTPLLAWSEEEQRWDAEHHPFTAPHPDDGGLLDTDPGKARSRGYDLVLNGHEVVGGSVRIHDPRVQARVLDLLGMDEAEANRRFGFFLEALRYGAPPHAGFAMGLDRIVAVLLRRPQIRDVIAFPKTLTATDPMTGAPASVDDAQMAELGLQLAPAAKPAAPDGGDESDA